MSAKYKTIKVPFTEFLNMQEAADGAGVTMRYAPIVTPYIEVGLITRDSTIAIRESP